jgi:hypothetical protein
LKITAKKAVMEEQKIQEIWILSSGAEGNKRISVIGL